MLFWQKASGNDQLLLSASSQHQECTGTVTHNNRVTLSSNKDVLGLTLPSLYWNMNNYVVKGTARTRGCYDAIAARLGATNIKHSISGKFSNRQHITVMLSMGLDPATSVTEQWGRADDHQSLLMTGAGVVPTFGTCNVTLTAMALRTADKIRQEAQHGLSTLAVFLYSWRISGNVHSGTASRPERNDQVRRISGYSL